MARMTARAVVKRAKREAAMAARQVIRSVRAGDCRSASEALGELIMLQGRVNKIAWSGRPPAVVTDASVRRLKNVYSRACRI